MNDDDEPYQDYLTKGHEPIEVRSFCTEGMDPFIEIRVPSPELHDCGPGQHLAIGRKGSGNLSLSQVAELMEILEYWRIQVVAIKSGHWIPTDTKWDRCNYCNGSTGIWYKNQTGDPIMFGRWEIADLVLAVNDSVFCLDCGKEQQQTTEGSKS